MATTKQTLSDPGPCILRAITSNEMSGMKPQWYNINHDLDGTKDFSTILNHFVIFNSMPNHIIESANAWDF